MAEILDTFCERCGKAAVSPLAKAPNSPKGLRRLLAKGGAKVETPVSALRLCLGCRGYVCDECWNEPASVCQSCQPLVGDGVSVPTFLDQLMTTAGYEVATDREGMSFANDAAWSDADDAARLAATTAWPETDLRRAAEREQAESLAKTDDVELPVVDWDAQLAEPADSQDASEAVDAQPAELAPEVEQALAAADEPAADEFEDRWAELMNRVQAVGVADEDGVSAPVVDDEAVAEPELSAQPEQDRRARAGRRVHVGCRARAGG